MRIITFIVQVFNSMNNQQCLFISCIYYKYQERWLLLYTHGRIHAHSFDQTQLGVKLSIY